MKSHRLLLAPRFQRPHKQDNDAHSNHVLLCLFAGFLVFLPSLVYSGSFVAFGPESYTRAAGNPVTVLRAFTVRNPNTIYTLQIYNGGLTDGELEKVSSSVITLNGVQVVGPSEFNQKVALVEKPVVLAENNQFSVELRGQPGGGIAIQIVGVDNDPPTISATVNPPANQSGWNNSNVTVSFSCNDSTSGIAHCPSPTPVNSDGANQVVSGTALDLAGNTASTSVTVNLDKTLPNLFVTSPPNGIAVTASPVTVTGTAADTTSGVASVTCNSIAAALSSSTFSCAVPLNTGPNTITVEATDFAGNSSSASIAVTLSQATVSLRITNPPPGSHINDYNVLVTGEFDNSMGEVGINVNGYVALQDGNEFATFVPLDGSITSLTATATSTAGTALASHTVSVTVQTPGAEQVLSFRPFPAIALVSQPVSFTLTSLNEIAQVQLDGNGDGTIDFTGTTLEGITVTFAEPGLYFPNVSVTDTSAAVFTDSAIIQVVDINQLDALLTTKWNSMKNALRSGNTARAASYILSSKRDAYQTLFNNLTIPFSGIDQMLGSITYQAVKGLEIEYEMLMNDGPDGDVSYLVLFSLDVDGVWKISFF
jgi:hypothetical protein